MKKALAILGVAGIGAGVMYLLDPDRGRRRRVLLRDKVFHETNEAARAVTRVRRDFGNRLKGLLAQAGSALQEEEPIDAVIVDRVRAKIGRVAAHPHFIHVASEAGEVVLSGPVLAGEVAELISTTSNVRGVVKVENNLQPRQSESELLGFACAPEATPAATHLPRNWSPTARLAAGAAGGMLIAYSASRRSIPGASAGAIGVGLVVRAITNDSLGTILGIGTDRRPIQVEKTLNIQAPVEEVFDFWTDHENFPLFMPDVIEVKSVGDGQYHWRVAGPAGMMIEWDGKITALVPNKLMAWETLPGSAIGQRGRVQFQPGEDENTCRIDVKMGYYPPAGVVGHAVAELLGEDPKHKIEQGLRAMKSLIETGRLPKEVAKRAARGTV